MTVLHSFTENGQTIKVKLDKGQKGSFGICIVAGEVKDSPTTHVSGIFIKDIIPQTPAHSCGKLKIGDRILSINDRDIRNATEMMVIDLIRKAGQVVNMEVQTFTTAAEQKDSNQDKNSSKPMENGYVANSKLERGMSKEHSESKPSQVIDEDDESDDEDTRDMTGRTYSAAGYEIDRASAGNVKRSEAAKNADPEQEDEYGYTQNKIKKRYGQLGSCHKVAITREPNTEIGLALAGHKDRRKMACFVAGINRDGPLGKADIKAGDEILEINGNVVYERCHLNVSVVFRTVATDKLVFIVRRYPANKSGVAVPPVERFPAVVDETENLVENFKNVRKVNVQKLGPSLGIMIIEGKHAELGKGIFISDIQAGSNAELAGLRIGEMILAINKDIITDTDYDTAAGVMKRAEGLITLVVANAKTEEEIEAEKKAEEEKKAAEAARKEAEKAKVPEKPLDPATAPIKTNQKTLIEIKPEKQPLGCFVVGGKTGLVTTGCVITHIHPDAVIAKDGRLQVFDQVLEFNGDPINVTEKSIMKVHQLFNLEYAKITMMIWRNDPPETETVNVELVKKPGKDLGISMLANPKGVLISDIMPGTIAHSDGRVQRGDIINKLNGDSLEGASYEESFALFRAAGQKYTLEILRPKPTAR